MFVIIINNISPITHSPPPCYSAPIPVSTDPRDLHPEAVASNLAAMSVGQAEVTASGSCSAFVYTIKMTSHAGDQPVMAVRNRDMISCEGCVLCFRIISKE